ncbi:MAG: hypothetical protein DWP97_06125 [Calditrichaeota bacterium]|nr:MAG: hypothetical protein DWP97_06125 [Calditrichota bacterium]
MKIKLICLILMPFLLPLLGHTQWKPTGFKTWQDSTNSENQRVLIGGTVQNYQKSDKSWDAIDNNWIKSDDTLFCINNANLKVVATSSGKTNLSIGNHDSTISLNQALQSLVLFDTEADTFFTLMNNPEFKNPEMDSNCLRWTDVFYGVDYALIKENGMLHHQISFKPKFLDSLQEITSQADIETSISFGTVSSYQFAGAESPDLSKHKLRKQILHRSKENIIQLHQQILFYPGYESKEEIPVFQRWIKEGNRYLCIEYVELGKMIQIHKNDPSAIIYHNASETFDADDVSDTYIRTDNGSFENYNYGVYATILLATELDGSAKRGCFLKFDLSSITDPVTVDSTAMHIAVIAQGDSVGLGYMTTDWSEGNVNAGAVDSIGEYGATWLQAKDSLGTVNDDDWANSSEFSVSDFDDNNGNYYGVVDASTTSWNAYLQVGSESSGNNSMIVSDWINGRTPNYGYCIFDMDLSTGTTIRPSEVVIAGFRPWLYIEYTINQAAESINQRRRILQKGEIE